MKRLVLAFALALCSLAATAAVNLNTATKDELVALPGIGPAKAQAILDYRSKNGAFKSIEELKDVKGIGAKRYEKIKSDLTVVGAPAKTAAKPGDGASKATDASPPQRMAKGAVTAGAKRDDAPSAQGLPSRRLRHRGRSCRHRHGRHPSGPRSRPRRRRRPRRGRVRR